MSPIIDSTSDAFVALSGFIVTPGHQRVALAIYELLATGRPAHPDEIAERSGVSVLEVEAYLGAWPATFLDAQGAVTGFFGLASHPSYSHRFDVEGVGTAWTWCTYDPLFITRVLGVTAVVTSRCPISGTAIRLTVTPEGVRDIKPSTAVMSMLSPDQASVENIITSLCQYILLFATPDDAHYWTSENPGTFVVSIDDGFEIARRMTDSVFGSVLDAMEGACGPAAPGLPSSVT
jgi:alkylmercury lyase